MEYMHDFYVRGFMVVGLGQLGGPKTPFNSLVPSLHLAPLVPDPLSSFCQTPWGEGAPKDQSATTLGGVSAHTERVMV